MTIKTINQIINEGINLPRRTTIPNGPSKTRGLLRNQVQQNISKNASSMKEVVPPLERGDFINAWREDRKALEETRNELNKYKKIVNTKFSSEWQKELLNDKNKKD